MTASSVPRARGARCGAAALALLSTLVLGLAGCGQKGPLTLPPPASAASAAPR